MTTLFDWVEYGLKTDNARNKRLVRRWLREARGHCAIIDRITYPETGIDRRLIVRFPERG
jgi:hypothetical protein